MKSDDECASVARRHVDLDERAEGAECRSGAVLHALLEAQLQEDSASEGGDDTGG